MRKLIAGATLALLMSGAAGTVFAGEITGGPHPKYNKGGDRARSECAFSGQEDGNTLIFPNGVPTSVEGTLTGPGYVQTPHQENGAFAGAGIIHEPGIAGALCRGNLPPVGTGG